MVVMKVVKKVQLMVDLKADWMVALMVD